MVGTEGVSVWSVCKAGARQGRGGSHTNSNHILHPPPLLPSPPSLHPERQGGGKGTTPREQISGGNDPLSEECASRGAK